MKASSPSGRTVFAFSVLVQAITMAMAVVASGAGHGSYALARIFFPFTMLSTIFNSRIDGMYLAVGLLQYLFYGLVFWAAVKLKRAKPAIAMLLTIHGLVVFAVFFWRNEYFPN